MKTYKINNKRYYLVNDIQTENPSIFKGCNNGRTPCGLILGISPQGLTPKGYFCEKTRTNE